MHFSFASYNAKQHAKAVRQTRRRLLLAGTALAGAGVLWGLGQLARLAFYIEHDIDVRQPKVSEYHLSRFK
jgi:hypothetical protein